MITSGNSKCFQTNRLCLVNPSEPAVIVGRSGQTVSVLMNERTTPLLGLEKEILAENNFPPTDENRPVVKSVEISEICSIFKDQVKVRSDDILYEHKKRQTGSACNQARVRSRCQFDSFRMTLSCSFQRFVQGVVTSG